MSISSLMSLPAKMTKNQVWTSVCVYYILYILKNCCGIFREKVRISDFLDSHSAVYVPHTNMHSICTFFYKCRPTTCHVVHGSGLRSLLMHSKTYKLSGRTCPWTPLEYVVGSTCLLTLKLPVLGTKKKFVRGFHYSLICVIQRPCLNLGFYSMQ